LQEPRLPTPTIRIDATSLSHIFLASDTSLSVCLDRVKLATVSSYMAALAALVSCYWVFNVELPRSTSRTLQVLAGHVCWLQPFKPTAAIQRGLNTIYG